jgi:hypothetical protein
MFLFVDKTTGKPLAAGAGWREPSSYQAELATILANNPGYGEDDLLPYEVSDRDRASALLARLPDLTATVEGGVVTALNPPPEPNQVWLHIALTGGDGDDPIGAANSGTEERELTAAITVRAAQDAASQILPLTGRWRIRFRRDTGEIYAIRRVQITNGQASIPFSVDDGAPEAELHIQESDFEPVTVGETTYTVRLASPVNIVVFKP